MLNSSWNTMVHLSQMGRRPLSLSADVTVANEQTKCLQRWAKRSITQNLESSFISPSARVLKPLSLKEIYKWIYCHDQWCAHCMEESKADHRSIVICWSRVHCTLVFCERAFLDATPITKWFLVLRIMKEWKHLWHWCFLILSKNTNDIAEKDQVSSWSKRKEVKYHYVRDQVRKGIVQLTHIATTNQVADVLTKAVPIIVLGKHSSRLLC